MSSANEPQERSDRMMRDTKLAAFRIWAVVGLLVIGAMLLNVIGVLAPAIEFLVLGSLIAFVESPIVNFLEHKGVSRGVGALLGLVVVIAAVVCIALVIIPALSAQILEILVRLPPQLRELGDWFAGIVEDFHTLSSSPWTSQLTRAVDALADDVSGIVTQIAGDLGRGVFPFISDFASQLFIVFLSLVLGYWLACDYPRIHEEIGTVVGGERETSYRFMVAILSRAVGGYMRGMVITSVVDGVLSFAGFALVGHPYAVLMGVLTGILHLIPVVGPWVSAAIAVVLALFISPVLAFWTLVVTVIAQNVTDNVVSPKVMQSAVQVHPAMSLTAIVIGSALMGALGMVIAIPLCAALKGLFVFYFERTTKRPLVSYEGAIFRGTPFRDDEGRPVPAYDALGDTSFVSDSELIDEDSAPEATAVPKPKSDLDNPWEKLKGLQPGSTGILKNPFSGDASAHGEGEEEGNGEDDGK